MSNDPAVMHALYPLADYPVLAELARSLKGAGAASVENRVLARTPRPG